MTHRKNKKFVTNSAKELLTLTMTLILSTTRLKMPGQNSKLTASKTSSVAPRHFKIGGTGLSMNPKHFGSSSNYSLRVSKTVVKAMIEPLI